MIVLIEGNYIDQFLPKSLYVCIGYFSKCLLTSGKSGQNECEHNIWECNQGIRTKSKGNWREVQYRTDGPFYSAAAYRACACARVWVLGGGGLLTLSQKLDAGHFWSGGPRIDSLLARWWTWYGAITIDWIRWEVVNISFNAGGSVSKW